MRTKGIRMRVTVDKKLTRWVDKRVESGFFRNRSHAIDYGLYILKKRIEPLEKKKGKGARP